jgi:SAM-dependent methyltransferase
MARPALDEQRLAFGRVAELYERARPAYPAGLIDELIEYAELRGGALVLEVGAGTGKGTRQLAERGLLVTALEPDPAMAAVARRLCAEVAGIEFEQVPFEEWRPREAVQAVISFQAWHWTEPGSRYELAASALSQDGRLAAIWTFPDWQETALREALRAAYAASAPQLPADFPMHPASEPTRLAGDWAGEISAAARLARPEVREYPWSARYSAVAYRELLETHQDHILLEPDAKARLLSAVSETIDAAGGIDLRFVSRLCLAQRV